MSLTQQFTATVTNTSNTAVTWQVNGVTGGNATVGTISTTGLYTAPAAVPATNPVTVKAISQADTTKFDTATVTITAPVSVAVSPKTATVVTGLTQQFTATVTNTSNTAVTWQVNGVTGGNATVGTISATGLYTAPAAVPATNPVTVKAISQADTTKFDTATVTITAPVSVAVSPKTATVVTGLTQQFTATVTNTSNTAVTWQVNGVNGGNATVGTISTTGLYTAPAVAPSPAAVTITAVSVADSTKSGSATVTILVAPGISVTVAPKSVSVAMSLTQQFTATVTNTSNTAVTWQVNGVIGGNATVGTISTTGLYTAPAAVPATNPVTVKAISQADATKSDTATVTITAPVSVAVSPKTATVVTSLTQQFTATVTNTSNTAVTWQVNGVIGGNATVGTISTTGLYTAPAVVPSPAAVTITAISVADATKSDAATVTVVFSVSVTLSPKTPSVQAGFTQQFTATVANSSNTAVTWQVNGVIGGNATVGTISTTGLYTAPAAVPATNPVTVKAISQADSTKFDTATVTITPPVSVAVSPKTPSVQVGLTQQFTATVTNATNTAVTWQVNGVTSGNTTVGTISATGLYTAPATVPATNPVTVKAISVADNTKSDTATVSVTPAPVIAVTVSPTMPSVQVNSTQQFTATVTNTANTAVTWQVNGVTGGDSTHGTINAGGLFTAPATVPTPATVTVTAISQADNTKSSSSIVTITAAAPVAVTISPLRAAITTGQTQTFAASVNGSPSTNVTWEIDTIPGGNSAVGTITAGGVYTPPLTGGVHSVVARSTVNITSASPASTVGVTDLKGVFTYHNDSSRDGVNAQEYALTTTNVNTAMFHKLFSCGVDGAIYAQPLWVANVNVGGVTRNVIVVATMHDSVYAFDADSNASPCVPLWHANVLDSSHGGTSGETSVPSSLLGGGFGDIKPEVGITGTPVIDSNTIYLVSKSVIGTTQFFQRLHALDLTTGNEILGGPTSITSAITFPGNFDNGTTVAFDPRNEGQRPGLALINGGVYVCWASHEDHDEYHGWVMGFSTTNLQLISNSVFNTTPNIVGSAGYARGGIWMSGGAPAVDSGNNLYVLTGNGTFDANNSGGANYGDTTLKLSTTGGLIVADWFTPADQSNLDGADTDHGAGGAAIIVNTSNGNFIIGGGKEGNLFMLNQSPMGHYGASTTPPNSAAAQIFSVGNPIFSTAAFWKNTLYIAPVGGHLQAFSFNTTTNLFNTSGASSTNATFGFPGATPSVSANATNNGVVWAIDASQYCTPQSPGCSHAVLHAFDGTNLSNELWNSSQVAADAAGFAVKFTVPTIANGKVYVGTRGNDSGNGTSSTLGELDVYGLKPN
jgi:hypothetical protein